MTVQFCTRLREFVWKFSVSSLLLGSLDLAVNVLIKLFTDLQHPHLLKSEIQKIKHFATWNALVR